jgi:hypothetical protein
MNACKGSSYNSEFDCKSPNKPTCKSLYQIIQEKDQGIFGPEGTLAQNPPSNLKCSRASLFGKKSCK